MTTIPQVMPRQVVIMCYMEGAEENRQYYIGTRLLCISIKQSYNLLEILAYDTLIGHKNNISKESW